LQKFLFDLWNFEILKSWNLFYNDKQYTSKSAFCDCSSNFDCCYDLCCAVVGFASG